jgi:hypothetical protein
MNCTAKTGLFLMAALLVLVTSQSNPYCSGFTSGVCNGCYAGYYLNNVKYCVVANPLCATIDSFGNCLSCYTGYVPSGGTCIASSNSNSNPYCSNYIGSICHGCYGGYYLNNVNNCLVANPLCATIDSFGNCITCYSGYIPSAGTCVLSNSGNSNPYCHSFNGTFCLACYGGYYLNNINFCTIANPLCASVDKFGNCLSCYSGYVVSGSTCVISNSANSNPDCKIFNGSICIACYGGYYLNNVNKCLLANPLCASVDQFGNCLSCYPDYVPSGGTCVISNSGNSNPDCKTFNGSTCILCYAGYYLNNVKFCAAANPLCAASDSFGNCISCYSGYVPSGGTCVISNSGNSNPYC